MRKLHSKGFTLIELLVVISIIGLLSSVVLAALSTAKDRGRVAGGQRFSTHSYRTLGDEAVAYYKFDEGSGAVVNDTWGSNNGSIVNGSWTASGMLNSAIYLPAGIDSYVNIPASSTFDPTPELTIMAWVKLDSVVSRQTLITEAWGSCCHYDKMVAIEAGRIYFYACARASACGGTAGETNSLIGITAGKWHHIAVTAKEGQRPNFYIDGILRNDSSSTIQYSVVDKHSGQKVTIGAMPPAGGTGTYLQRLAGYIDELGVYKKSFGLAQIQEYYAITAPKYGIAVNK
jgi:prepilin-type N-terminal cleavage/methylation domain-containing protein